MKYIIDLRIIIVCVGILSLFACNEDKGNYDYEAINRVTEIANIQESYSVEVGERLLITPELNTTSGNTDNLDYTWYYKSGSAWNVLQEGKDFPTWDFHVRTSVPADITIMESMSSSAFSPWRRQWSCFLRSRKSLRRLRSRHKIWIRIWLFRKCGRRWISLPAFLDV